MSSIEQNQQQTESSGSLIVGFWGVRYQIKDVQRAIAFYTQVLGFNLDLQHLPAFGRFRLEASS